mmetsp:Transcript_46643/g.117495  ORF Transcript_46643/g.117495 Transcript_46643/m.117495 type:complete len:538 (-) Transcript_46643:52-1665(-)
MKRFGSTKRSKGLPRILTATTTYLLPEDITPMLKHEIVPDAAKVSHLKSKFRKQSKHVDLTKWEDEVILGVLQIFFSEMNDCVLTCDLYSCWTAAMGIPDRSTRVVSFQQVLGLLEGTDEMRLRLVQFVFDWLHKMTQRNHNIQLLAAFFGPFLLWPSEVTPHDDPKHPEQVVAALLRNYEQVFLGAPLPDEEEEIDVADVEDLDLAELSNKFGTFLFKGDTDSSTAGTMIIRKNPAKHTQTSSSMFRPPVATDTDAAPQEGEPASDGYDSGTMIFHSSASSGNTTGTMVVKDLVSSSSNSPAGSPFGTFVMSAESPVSSTPGSLSSADFSSGTDDYGPQITMAEDWELAILGLERGEKVDEMSDMAFKRWNRKRPELRSSAFNMPPMRPEEMGFTGRSSSGPAALSASSPAASVARLSTPKPSAPSGLAESVQPTDQPKSSPRGTRGRNKFSLKKDKKKEKKDKKSFSGKKDKVKFNSAPRPAKEESDSELSALQHLLRRTNLRREESVMLFKANMQKLKTTCRIEPTDTLFKGYE